MFFIGTLLLLLAASVQVTQQNDCSKALGAEDGRIKNSQFTASTSISYHYPHYARLNRYRIRKDGKLDGKTWCGVYNDKNPWIRIHLNQTHRITAVAVQGRNSSYSGWYVKKFQVGYSDWDKIRKIGTKFEGPQSKNAISKVSVDFVTSDIYIFPVVGETHPSGHSICLRLELYGCPEIKVRDYCKGHKCDHKCMNEKSGLRCTCNHGYRLNSDGQTCDDIDECSEVHTCDRNSTTCHNEDGGYQCKCLSGMIRDNAKSCSDKNECDETVGPCQQICINKHRSYRCDCRHGYRLSNNSVTCDNIDECREGKDACNSSTSYCVDNKGGYRCQCKQGLEHKPFTNKTLCQDIDECAVLNGGCSHTCQNIHASHTCSCPNGTFLDSNGRTCVDINECDDKTLNDCDQTCQNNFGGYWCGCKSGYDLADDKKTCNDIDECKKNPCTDHCKNNNGSFVCSCDQGLKLLADGRTCKDIDECATNQNTCNLANSHCINIRGSYECRCKNGYQKTSTGQCIVKSCSWLRPPKNGYLEPSDCTTDGAIKFKEVCSFKCHDGYQLTNRSADQAHCDEFGQWDYNGYVPICQRIRCPKMTPSANMQIVPDACEKQGQQYERDCQIYCTIGSKPIGQQRFTCQKNGQYNGAVNNSLCVKGQQLVCPKDVTVLLPLGAKDTILPLMKLSEKVDVKTMVSNPPGVLTGQYRFAPKTQPDLVKLTKTDQYGLKSTCQFYVRVVDREAPKVTNCPTKDVYITLNKESDLVTWNEPQFNDNIRIAKTFVNIPNRMSRAEQVYFVYYSANDEAGNHATCRFFVHVAVKVKSCKKETLPGGDGGNKFFIGGVGGSMSVYLTCPPGTHVFSSNVTGPSIFHCKSGIWSDVPDCVAATAKTDTSDCADGKTVIQSFGKLYCANCPKGTTGIRGICIPCQPGFYQDVTGSTICKQCPIGTTSLRPGGKSPAVCQANCQPGTYSMTGLYGGFGCQRCPKGSYQSLRGQQSCKVCPGGGISNEGSVNEDDCKLPAYVSRIFPEGGSVSARVGANVTIDCYATGSPRPRVLFRNVTALPPDNVRGQKNISPITTGNKHISALRMVITGATPEDSSVYECIADNRIGQLGRVDRREISLEVLY